MTKHRKPLFVVSFAVCILAGVAWTFTASLSAAGSRAPTELHITIDDGGARTMDDPLVSYDVTATAHNGPADEAVVTAIVPEGAEHNAAASTSGWSCSGGGSAGSQCSLTLGLLQPDTPVIVQFVVIALLNLDLYVEATLGATGLPFASAEVVTAYNNVATCENDFVFCAAVCFACYYLQLDPACFWLTSPFQTAVKAERLGNVPGLVGSSPGFTIFRLRDRVLSTTRGGRRASDLYYEHSPAILNATLGDPTIMSDGLAVISAWNDGLAALVDGEGGAVTVTQGQIDAVNTFLDNLRSSAVGDLAATIDRERANLDIDGLVGQTMDDVMAEIELLSCEGYESTLFCGEVTGDCAVTATDALSVLKIAVGSASTVPQADVDGSGAVTASDALRTLRIAVGSEPPTSDCNPI